MIPKTDPKLPKLIYKTTSEYNELIEVYQVGKARRLSVNGIIQSISWDSPFQRKTIFGQLVGFVKKKRPESKAYSIIWLRGRDNGSFIYS